MPRRGELSMEVIVVAAIAVLVLAILAFLIVNWGKIFHDGTQCTQIGGAQCADSCEGLGDYAQVGYEGCGEGQVCCLPIGEG